MTGQDNNTAQLTGLSPDELKDRQYNAACLAMAKVLENSMRALKELADDTETLQSVTEDTQLLTRQGWTVYAYRDVGNDGDVVVCGVDYGLYGFFSTVVNCITDAGLEVDELDAQNRGEIRVAGDAEQCTDDFLSKVEDAVEKLAGLCVSIRQDWEFAPPTVKIECYVDAPFKKDCDDIAQDEFDRVLGDIVAEEGRALLTVPGVYEVLSEHFNNEVLERYEGGEN